MHVDSPFICRKTINCYSPMFNFHCICGMKVPTKSTPPPTHMYMRTEQPWSTFEIYLEISLTSLSTYKIHVCTCARQSKIYAILTYQFLLSINLLLMLCQRTKLFPHLNALIWSVFTKPSPLPKTFSHL